VSVEGNLAMAGNCLVGLITVTRQRDAAVVAEARP
jgi:hypothetical protein